jgi:adenylate cyclase
MERRRRGGVEQAMAATGTGEAGSTAGQDLIQLWQSPSNALSEIIGAKRLAEVNAIVDWLRPARRGVARAEDIEVLSGKLVALGLPLDRLTLSISILHAQMDAIGRSWEQGKGASENNYIRPSEDDPTYRASPFYATAQSGAPLELWLDRVPDTAYGIVPDLKRRGYVQYICLPVSLLNGSFAWVTLATRAKAGFSASDLAVVLYLFPALSALIEIRLAWRTLDTVLSTYVGDEPKQAILAGNVKRGQVTTIESAILFADMRDSSILTADMTSVAAVAFFNRFFDCLVPAIEAQHGEVLKYMGDGLLAIFRESTVDPRPPQTRALAASRMALQALAAYNDDHQQGPSLRAGLALHFGAVAYGNIGSGLRLDFTVIGRDVALASRIAGLNRPLKEPLLVSKAFAQRLGEGSVWLGQFEVRGFREPVDVYRPSEA